MSRIDKLVVLISAILPTIRIVKFFPDISLGVYYGWYMLVLIYVTFHKVGQINKSVLLLYLFSFLSILFNDIDPNYKVESRFMGFVILVSSLGPLLSGKWQNSFKISIFNFVSILIIFLTCLSFLIYLYNPELMITERGNLYGGVTKHSMIMGPISGISILLLLHCLLTQNNKMSFVQKVIIYVLLILSCLSCMLAGSRSALISCFISIVVLIRLYYKDHLLKFLKVVTLISIIPILTTPIWWKYTETISKKMEYSAEHGSAFITREALWSLRINEIKENPLFGCGFATVSTKPDIDGIVEPGNGWLFVMSSSGVICFLLFVFIYFYSLRNLYRTNKAEASLFLSLLIMIGIHMNAEGYSLSCGSYMFFIYWLVIGISYSFRGKGDNQIFMYYNHFIK